MRSFMVSLFVAGFLFNTVAGADFMGDPGGSSRQIA